MRSVLAVMLVVGMTGVLLTAQSRSAAEKSYDEAVYVEVVKGNLRRAIEMYGEVMKLYPSDQKVAGLAAQRLAAAKKQIEAPGRPATVEQLVLDGGGFVGRPSPDGRYLPWVKGRRLTLRNLMTGLDTEIRPGSDRTTPESEFFTADSRRVIYDWFDGPSDSFQLRIVDIDGRNDRVLVPNLGIRGYGAASPDRQSIAVPVRREGVDQIVLVDLRSGKPATLRSLEWRQPEIGNFSPDGRFLVYSARTAQDSSDRTIHIVAVDGSSETTVAVSAGTNRDPFFAPDGRHIVFSSNRSGGRWDLLSVAIENGKVKSEPRLLKSDTGSISLLGLTADSSLLYTRTLGESNAYEAEIDPLTWRVTGLPRRLSERYVGVSFAPRWSPDGSALVYAAREAPGENGDVAFVVRAPGPQGEKSHKVADMALVAHSFPNAIQWFPDRKSLLLTKYAPPGRQFHRFDLTTGTLTLLFTARQSTLSSIVTSDGTAVLYPLTEPDDPSTANDERTNKWLIRRDLATGDERTVLKGRTGGNGSAAFQALSASPDGTRIAWVGGGRAVWIAALDTGEMRELATIPRTQEYSSAWDAAGRGVLVNVGGTDGATEIWYVPIDGSPAHPTGISMPGARLSSVHPDGRRIAFSAGSGTAQIMRLTNLDAAVGAPR